MSEKNITPTPVWEFWYTKTPQYNDGEYMHSCGIQKGKDVLTLDLEVDENEILQPICDKLNSFDEREALVNELVSALEAIVKEYESKETTYYTAVYMKNLAESALKKARP